MSLPLVSLESVSATIADHKMVSPKILQEEWHWQNDYGALCWDLEVQNSIPYLEQRRALKKSPTVFDAQHNNCSLFKLCMHCNTRSSTVHCTVCNNFADGMEIITNSTPTLEQQADRHWRIVLPDRQKVPMLVTMWSVLFDNFANSVAIITPIDRIQCGKLPIVVQLLCQYKSSISQFYDKL